MVFLFVVFRVVSVFRGYGFLICSRSLLSNEQSPTTNHTKRYEKKPDPEFTKYNENESGRLRNSDKSPFGVTILIESFRHQRHR